MILGQKLEFSKPPFQNFVPRERNYWYATQIQMFKAEIKSLQKGAIVPCWHEPGEYISPVFTTTKKDGSSRMILSLKGLNEFIEYVHSKIESFSTAVSLVKRNLYGFC